MAIYFQEVSSFAIGIILLLSAVTKWLNFHWFVGVLRKYALAPAKAAGTLALLVASAELLVGILLVLRLWLPWPAYGALSLFLVFTVAVSINLARGRHDFECGCGGFWGRNKLRWNIVLRNLGLMGLTLVSIHPVAGVYPIVFAASGVMVVLPLLFGRSTCT